MVRNRLAVRAKKGAIWRAVKSDFGEWFVSRTSYVTGSSWFIGRNQPRLARIIAAGMNLWERTGRERGPSQKKSK